MSSDFNHIGSELLTLPVVRGPQLELAARLLYGCRLQPHVAT